MASRCAWCSLTDSQLGPGGGRHVVNAVRVSCDRATVGGHHLLSRRVWISLMLAPAAVLVPRFCTSTRNPRTACIHPESPGSCERRSQNSTTNSLGSLRSSLPRRMLRADFLRLMVGTVPSSGLGISGDRMVATVKRDMVEVVLSRGFGGLWLKRGLDGGGGDVICMGDGAQSRSWSALGRSVTVCW